MMDSHCEIMWSKNSGAGLEQNPTAFYGAAPNDQVKQTITPQQRLRYKNIGLCIKNSSTADSKQKLRGIQDCIHLQQQI